MARRSKVDQKRFDLMLKLPDDTRRVKVKTEMGETKYVSLGELGNKDEILTNRKGEPIVMRGRPGRKTQINLEPINDAVRAAIDRKKDLIDQDPLVQAVVHEPDSDKVLHEVLKGLTDEVASLAYERSEAERTGQGTSTLSVRRISGLKAAADTWLKRKDQIAGKSLDPTSPGFKAAFQYILETVQEAMAAVGQRPEMVQAIFAKFGQLTAQDNWEAELRARVKKS